MLSKLFKHRHKWKAVRTFWPYPDGWGVRCNGCRVLVDAGLSKVEAERLAKELER